MITLTRKQREALHCKWVQDNQGLTYIALRRTITIATGFDNQCVMLYWSGMWLGIENDGYTHS